MPNLKVQRKYRIGLMVIFQMKYEPGAMITDRYGCIEYRGYTGLHTL